MADEHASSEGKAQVGPATVCPPMLSRVMLFMSGLTAAKESVGARQTIIAISLCQASGSAAEDLY
jgi:hypothetical protein